MSALVNYEYWKWDAVLSKEFCNLILEQIDWANAEVGGINSGEPLVNLEKRRTDIVWQDMMQPIGCMMQAYINAANQSAEWGYALHEQQQTQFCRYKSFLFVIV